MRHSIAALAILAGLVIADPNDWVNPAYVLAAAKNPPVGTAKSVQSILHLAAKSAKGGPWALTNSTVFAPSGNPRDYFSWAPYHWPNCNWCTASHVNSSAAIQPGAGATSAAPLSASGQQQAGGDEDEQDEADAEDADLSKRDHVDRGAYDETSARQDDEEDWFRQPWSNETDTDDNPTDGRPVGRSFNALSNFRRPVKRQGLATSEASVSTASASASTLSAEASSSYELSSARASYEQLDVKATSRPPPGAASASRAAGAKGPQVSATQRPTATSSATCTVSSTYVAPTATYSVCKYVQRDGQVNPDVRTLNSSDFMGKVSTAGMANALSWVLTRDAEYSRTASQYIETFFISNTTGMNPNLNYGQVVRGPPGNQFGSFMAVVDLRGMTKIANAVQLLRQSDAPNWTLDRDRRLVTWAKAYVNWLQTSAIGKKAAQAANNHGSFYVNQLAALQILMGDYNGAKATLVNFFSTIFKDQITAKGEQPFEAIRTRPYHYRAFNLEALIVNAKLADQLGLNMWQVQSKYGATIQMAIDFTMNLDPKGEDTDEMVPHVLLAAAVYGDPKGKYLNWVKKVMPDYDSRVYNFYDQVGAFTSSPASGKKVKPAARKRDVLQHDLVKGVEDPSIADPRSALIAKRVAGNASYLTARSVTSVAQPISDIPSSSDFTQLRAPLYLAAVPRSITQRSHKVNSNDSDSTIESQWTDLIRMRNTDALGSSK